jgi:hypothetical protein
LPSTTSKRSVPRRRGPFDALAADDAEAFRVYIGEAGPGIGHCR